MKEIAAAERRAMGINFCSKPTEIAPDTKGFFTRFAAVSNGKSITSLLHPTTNCPAKIASAICIESKVLNSNLAVKNAIVVTRTVGPKWEARRSATTAMKKVYFLVAESNPRSRPSAPAFRELGIALGVLPWGNLTSFMRIACRSPLLFMLRVTTVS
jgi:hypothetical protein